MDLVTKVYQITVQLTNEWHIAVDEALKENDIRYTNIGGRIRIWKVKLEYESKRRWVKEYQRIMENIKRAKQFHGDKIVDSN